MKPKDYFPVALLLLLIGCQPGGVAHDMGLTPHFSGVYQAAYNTNTIEGYYKFLRAVPNDPMRENGIKRLVKLLNKDPDEVQLKRFIKTLPQYAHLVENSLKRLKIREKIAQRVNDFSNLTAGYQYRNNSSSFTLVKGEPFFGFRYSKTFVGLADAEEEDREFSFEIEYQRIPPWIKIELDKENSIGYAQRYNLYANVKYLVWLARSAPDRDYPIQITFAVYSQVEDSPKERVGEITVTHSIHNRENKVIATEGDVHFYAELARYYHEKEKETSKINRKIVKPETDKFAPFYLYERQLHELKFNIRRYRAFQKTGLYKLEEASRGGKPGIREAASRQLASLKSSGISQDRIASKDTIPFDMAYATDKLQEHIVVREDIHKRPLPAESETVIETSPEENIDEAIDALDDLLTEDGAEVDGGAFTSGGNEEILEEE
ncbi:MAG: hypothetical protein ACE5GM_01375 [bacterium]